MGSGRLTLANRVNDIGQGELSQPLDVADALDYLDAVKAHFANQPGVYDAFLNIMKDFKGQE